MTGYIFHIHVATMPRTKPEDVVVPPPTAMCHQCVTSREARSARIELGKFRVSRGVTEVAMATGFLVK
jgi:hypothetical protein